MKVLIIGSGGREYAIAKALNASKKCPQVYAIPGCNLWKNVKSFSAIDILDFIAIKDIIQKHHIELVLVGPEIPIIMGIYDFCKEHNIKCIAPTKFCSQIESSKIFAKDLMQIFNVPTAKFDFAITYGEYENKISNFTFPVVLKSDNVAAGKGVLVTNSLNKANKFVKDILEQNRFGQSNRILIEEYMEGEEFSLICLVNHGNVIALPPICDHKTIAENHQGPMTGGMGVFNHPKFLTDAEIKECIETCIMPVVNGIKDSNPYYGILFAGIMKTSNNKFKVIEYNVRFGDPETEILLPLIKNDFLDLIIDFYLNNTIPKLEFHSHYSLGVVVAATGYPEAYEKNLDLNFLQDNTNIIPMGMMQKNHNLLSTSGRIFMYYKVGDDFKQLYQEVYEDLKKLIPKNCQKLLHYRKDIGKRNI